MTTVKAKTTKAFVLHSGGVDSSTCLFMAVRDYGHRNVQAISVNYRQRHIKETDFAKALCDRVGVNHRVVMGPQDLDSMLNNPEEEIPSSSYADLPEGISPTYVPFRTLLYSRLTPLPSRRSRIF